MRRLDLIVAGGFVVLGLLCLLTASGVWIGSPMGTMGGMMVSVNAAMVLAIVVLVLMALALVLYLVRALARENVRDPHCVHCGRRLLPVWRACPYCGERVREHGS